MGSNSSSNRQYENEGDHHHSKRKRQDDTSQNSLTRFYFSTGIYRSELYLETDVVPFFTRRIRTVVRDAMNRSLSDHRLRTSGGNKGASEGKAYKLVFENAVPDTIFTASNIKAKDGKPVKITLRDAKSGSLVTEGPLSSMAIKICVLNNDLMVGPDESRPQIMRPRNHKGQLLKGETVIYLRNGVSWIGNTKFTDNSHCTRTGRYRLGAMAQSPFNQAITKEAKSEAFVVKEGRLEENQKHYPPFPNDPVWRLESIAKGKITHGWLSKLGITTVEDLLLKYETDRSSLYKNDRISAQLKKAIRHAQTCNRQVMTHNTDGDVINADEKRLERGKQHALPFEGTSSAHSFQIPSTSSDLWGKMQDFGQPSTSSTPLRGTEAANISEDFSVFDTENDFAFFPMGMGDKM